ncbi:DNA-3-methyladenine glycosylase [Limosilactobacillus sp.]|jgi:DNA-3-methyladenine glycosylase|uniref:DNA-3-methyladenine glycosylase n=1 Tax=Limosilactobacillus sp. TaxID=2773925 RepID=UPI0035A088A4
MVSAYQHFFTDRPTVEIARDLLGKLVCYNGPDGRTGGYIVETEAYLGENDSASHAFNGRRTGYSASLYGQPGDIYLYQIRGHYCFDIVVQDREDPQGILLRGIEPAIGIKQMQEHRGMTGVNVSNGPGKLVQALGIHSRDLDGQPMATSPLYVDLNQFKIPREIKVTARIGVNLHGKDGAKPRRFFVAGNPYVSGMRKRAMDLEDYGWKD